MPKKQPTKKPTTAKRTSKPVKKTAYKATTKKPVAKKVVAKRITKPVVKRATKSANKRTTVKPVTKRTIAKKPTLSTRVVSQKQATTTVKRQGILITALGVVMAFFLGVFILPNIMKTFNKDQDVLGSRTTGQSAPYTLELFAIEVLKSIAQKKGIDPSNTVTFEHTLALIAFAMGEGGDIANNSLFNPFNSGLKAPDLNSGKFNASGLQSFDSFDAGVEAAARHMTNTNQSRLGNILSKKDSTAQDFMYALTYYTKYPGNNYWAGSSKTNPNGYYKERLGIVSAHLKNYRNSATTVLGTSAHEKTKGIRALDKLVYDSSTKKPISGKESVVTATVPPKSSPPAASTPTPVPTFTVNKGKITYAKWVKSSDNTARIKFKSDIAQDWYQLSCNDKNGKLIPSSDMKIANTLNSKDNYRYSNEEFLYKNVKCFISGVIWNGTKNIWGDAIVIAQPDTSKATPAPTPKVTTTTTTPKPKTDTTALKKLVTLTNNLFKAVANDLLKLLTGKK